MQVRLDPARREELLGTALAVRAEEPDGDLAAQLAPSTASPHSPATRRSAAATSATVGVTGAA